MWTKSHAWFLLPMLAPVVYWGATTGMVEYSARHISSVQGCTHLIPFDHNAYLISMGQRSIPALQREIANPLVGINRKIHLAWLLCRLGDYSRFGVLISGLGSTYQYHAAARIRDFPDQCLLNLPAILARGGLAGSGAKPHQQYWNLLATLAQHSTLAENKKEKLFETFVERQVESKGLTETEIQQILQQFKGA